MFKKHEEDVVFCSSCDLTLADGLKMKQIDFYGAFFGRSSIFLHFVLKSKDSVHQI